MSLMVSVSVFELARLDYMSRSRRRKLNKQRAISATIGWLCANKPQFKAEWNAATKEERRRWMKAITG